MIRSVLATLLRRQLQEATADAWADADILVLLNAGCDEVAKRFFAGDPDRAPLTTTLSAFLKETGYGYDEVALPDNVSRIFDVSLLQTDGTYLPVTKESRAIVEGLVAGDDAHWAFLGQSIIVGPAPSISQANGVRIRHWGGITLAADGTTPPFPPVLHMAIVYEAKAIALGETGEDDTPTARALARVYAGMDTLMDGGGEAVSWGMDRRASTEY